MRLNPDCVRDTLLSLEKHLLIDEYGETIQLSFEDIASLQELSQYDSKEIFFVLHQLFGCDILKAGKRYINDSAPRICDITEKGYKFIDSVKSQTNWKKIKDTSKTLGIFALKTLIELALKSQFEV